MQTNETGQRRLLLLRHGKAESPAGVSDRDRPLAKRGRRQSEYAGAECRRLGLMPDLVVASPALRARQTSDAFAEGLEGTPETDVDPRVYANTVDDLLAVVDELPDETRTVLLVGHNPSLDDLARTLDNDATRRATTDLADGFPTGTLAVFAVDVAWNQLTVPGRTRLVDVIRRSR
jgi:phosphohistidine phosphatase